MKTHKIGGKFVQELLGLPEGSEASVEWPETLKEIKEIVNAGSIKVNGKDFPISEEKICSWSYRGFSLQHQGAGGLSDEEKAQRKEARKEESNLKKALKEKGVDLKSLIKQALAEKA